MVQGLHGLGVAGAGRAAAAELSEHTQAVRLVLLQGTSPLTDVPPADVAPEAADSHSETDVSG